MKMGNGMRRIKRRWMRRGKEMSKRKQTRVRGSL